MTLHERLITKLGGKRVVRHPGPAFQVVPEKAPLGVARYSFGLTKPRASRLDWHFFWHNGSYLNSVSRP